MDIIYIVFIIFYFFYLVAFLSKEETENEENEPTEADNFNVVRQLTVINCITGGTLFQMTGRLSITADTSDNQLEILVEDDDGSYSKHFVGLSDNTTYIVEDLNLGENEVDSNGN